MRITITARHCDVVTELRERARELMGRLERIARRPEDARVIFGTDHGACTVEAQLHRGGGRVFIALGSGPDHRSALDRAVAKLRRQLDKAPVRRARPVARRLR